ncbi:hypothetical protein BZA05DRAFT_448194 [Tricharina praecox]|uniref:uncharacterized protein n=1 Tax=Tricharina praecox TaxID=43433 RepID=UPI00221F88A4|nr:uncharacterized protein BZA05DRAFT_448194 [Tricharina praecox]KAI5844708.1 hypothetical protein BZA05DRAFT_448194 [Tricharina praecox]
MKYIDDDVRRRHTFDKRRQRLFQEARDLSILCGTEYALVVASDSQIFTEASPNLAGLLSDEGRNAILDCLHGKVGESDAADGARAINQSPSPPAPDIENRAAV